MSKWTENCFEIGARLKREESEARERNVQRVLQPSRIGEPFTRENRAVFADMLYHARWDGHSYDYVPSHEEVLNMLCWKVFGANYEEVLEAWDRFLG